MTEASARLRFAAGTLGVLGAGAVVCLASMGGFLAALGMTGGAVPLARRRGARDEVRGCEGAGQGEYDGGVVELCWRSRVLGVLE